MVSLSESSDKDPPTSPQIEVWLERTDARIVHGLLRIKGEEEGIPSLLRQGLVHSPHFRIVDSGGKWFRGVSRGQNATGAITARIEFDTSAGWTSVSVVAKPSIRFVFGPTTARTERLVRAFLDDLKNASSRLPRKNSQ